MVKSSSQNIRKISEFVSTSLYNVDSVLNFGQVLQYCIKTLLFIIIHVVGIFFPTVHGVISYFLMLTSNDIQQ